MTSPGSDAQYVVQAVQENAERLGLIWKRKRGTVTSENPLMVVLDGDTEPISATSMIGSARVDQRVYVDVVPPSANFISGTISAAGELSSEVINVTSGAYTTSSPNFGNMNIAALPFTKRSDSTRLVLQMHATGYLTGAVGSTVDIGLLINGGDYIVGTLVYNNALQHLQISGVQSVVAGAVPAGDYNTMARARVSGGGTFTMDGGDRVSFEVVEKA